MAVPTQLSVSSVPSPRSSTHAFEMILVFAAVTVNDSGRKCGLDFREDSNRSRAENFMVSSSYDT